MDGSIRGPDLGSRVDWRRRSIRHARGGQETGTTVDAAKRARMAVPPRRRTATTVAALSDQQPLVCVAPPAAMDGRRAPRSRCRYSTELKDVTGQREPVIDSVPEKALSRCLRDLPTCVVLRN